jgi:hypothetical protein
LGLVGRVVTRRACGGGGLIGRVVSRRAYGGRGLLLYVFPVRVCVCVYADVHVCVPIGIFVGFIYLVRV